VFLWLSRAAAVRKREKKRRRRRRTTRGTIWSLSFSPTTPCAIHNRRRRRRRHTISPPSSSLCLLRQESTSSSVLMFFFFFCCCLLGFKHQTDTQDDDDDDDRFHPPFPVRAAIHGRVRLLFSSLRPARSAQNNESPIQNKTKEEEKERGPHRFCIFVLRLSLNLLLLRHQQRSFISRIFFFFKDRRVKVSSFLRTTALIVPFSFTTA